MTHPNQNGGGGGGATTTTTKHKYAMLGPYRLLRTIGEGEFGKVKLAVHAEDSQEVAIKLIKKENIETPNRRSKLLREITILQSLDHPYIVKLIEVIETDHYIGMVMEFASGGELFEYILAHRYLKERDACRFFAQLLAGVSFIHSVGIVHRDLKLENLLLDSNRNIIITDFGFANRSRNGDSDLLLTSCGSPCYAAPELVISDGYVGEAADIWSCGVILYAMLCGYLPFDDDPENPDSDNINLLYKYILETQLEFPDYVSADARSLLLRMLVPDPKYRAKMPEIMTHRWLAPAFYIFEEEMRRRQSKMAAAAALATPPPESPPRQEVKAEQVPMEVDHHEVPVATPQPVPHGHLTPPQPLSPSLPIAAQFEAAVAVAAVANDVKMEEPITPRSPTMHDSAVASSAPQSSQAGSPNLYVPPIQSVPVEISSRSASLPGGLDMTHSGAPAMLGSSAAATESMDEDSKARLQHSRSASETPGAVVAGTQSPRRANSQRRPSESSHIADSKISGSQEEEDRDVELARSSSMKGSSSKSWFKKKTTKPAENESDAISRTSTSVNRPRKEELFDLLTSDNFDLLPPTMYTSSKKVRRRQNMPVEKSATSEGSVVSASSPSAPIDSATTLNSVESFVNHSRQSTSNNNENLPRPSMQAPSISASDYNQIVNGQKKPRKLKNHSGPIDQRALTSRNPNQLLEALEDYFLDAGFDVLSNGDEIGEYKLKLVRPKTKIAQPHAEVATLYDESFVASDFEDMPGVDRLAARPSEDVSRLRAADAVARGGVSIDLRRTGTQSTNAQKEQAFKERKRRAKGATKLALIVASLPVSLVKRIKYFTQHGPNYNKGFDGKTTIEEIAASTPTMDPVTISRPKSSLGGETGTTLGGGDGSGWASNAESEVNGPTASSDVGVNGGTVSYLDEIKFYVEIEKIKNLPGLYVVDFKRLRGDIWAFKKMYHSLIVDLPLKEKEF